MNTRSTGVDPATGLDDPGTEQVEFDTVRGRTPPLFERLRLGSDGGTSMGHPDDTEGEDDEDDRSRVSSTFSAGTDAAEELEYERLRGMVRLDDSTCRVKCQTQRTLGCCGGPKGDCGRRGHSEKPEDVRGRPGMYDPLARSSKGFVDGKWPPGGVPPLSFLEYDRLLAASQRARDEDLNRLIEERLAEDRLGVGATNPDETVAELGLEQAGAIGSRSQPTVTFGHLLNTPQATNRVGERTRPTSEHSSPGSANTYRTAFEENSPHVEWFGLTRDTGDGPRPWRVVDSLDKAGDLLGPGVDFGPTFGSYEAAKAWFTSGGRLRPKVPRPAPAPVVTRTVETTTTARSESQLYFGFTRDGERALAFDKDQQMIYFNANPPWFCSLVMDDLAEAQKWLAEGTRVKPHVDLTQTNVGAESDDPGLPEVTRDIRYGGPDPSTGNEKAIFDMPLTNWMGIQARMVPQGMLNRDAVLIVSEAADPCACPERVGTSLSVDAEDQLQAMTNIVDSVVDTMNNWTEAHNEQAGRGRQRFSQAVQNKALEDILKDPTKIGTMILEFDETWPYEKEHQDLSFRAHLARLGYSENFIDQWVETGLLPVMIRQVCTWHRALLQATHSDYLNYPNIPWGKEHPAYNILFKVYTKVAFLRKNSRYKANFLCKVYVFYREGSKNGFGRDLMNQSYLHTLEHHFFKKGTAAGESTNSNSGAAATRYCTHCGAGTSVHAAGQCPYTHIAKTSVKKAFGRMTAGPRKKVHEVFKRLEDADPKGNHLGHLETAIQEINGST